MRHAAVDVKTKRPKYNGDIENSPVAKRNYKVKHNVFWQDKQRCNTARLFHMHFHREIHENYK